MLTKKLLTQSRKGSQRNEAGDILKMIPFIR